MQNESSLLIGLLIGFIYTLAAAVIIMSLNNRKEPSPPKQLEDHKPTTLGDIRKLLAKAQEGIQQSQEQVWDYGTGEEEKARRWRIACTSVASTAADVLQSCWLGREQDATSQAIYDELMGGLRIVGLEEIMPSLGQEVTENDRHYRIKHVEGEPPYKVSKLLCPGYQFKLSSDKAENANYHLLEPAQVEVIGNAPADDQLGK